MTQEILPKSRLPAARGLSPEEREEQSLWMKQQIAEVAAAYEERIEVLRNGGEHPSPIFQKMVQYYAMCGLEEQLIAKMLFIPHQTLIVHYKDELEMGYAEIVVRMSETAIKIGMDPEHKDAAKVALEILSRRGGEHWQPPVRKKEDVTPEKKQGRIIDSSKLSYEDRQLLKDMILRADAEEQKVIEAPDEAQDESQEDPNE